MFCDGNPNHHHHAANTQPPTNTVKMCLQTTTTYDNCLAVRVHLDVCASHIEHTRVQLDNLPCPDFEKKHQHVKNSTRCYCKAAGSMSRDAGFAVGVACVRMASRGYGENGLTWSFEKGPDLNLKGKITKKIKSINSLICHNESVNKITMKMRIIKKPSVKQQQQIQVHHVFIISRQSSLHCQ